MAVPDTSLDRDALKKSVLFVPCATKKALHNWIKIFLGLDIPDCIVDPDSNCSPMDFLWEVYSKALKNDDPDFNRVLYYASRDSFKTLGAAILEVLCVVHLGRDVAHMAAIEPQAAKAQNYVKGFLQKPYLREFMSGDNKRETWVVRYKHRDSDASISTKEYESLSTAEQSEYEENRRYIIVIICTVAGANGAHCPVLCVDGLTDIKCRISADSVQASSRARKSQGARGIFRYLEGRNPGGRTGAPDEQPTVIENPERTVEFLTLDQNTGQWTFSPVVRAQRSYQEVFVVKTDKRELRCTGSHPLLTPNGFKMLRDLNPGDVLLAVNKSKTVHKAVNNDSNEVREEVGEVAVEHVDEWEQVLLGTLLGDCGIYKKPMNNPYIQQQHCNAQAAYMEWKREIIARKLRTTPLKNPTSGYTGEQLVGFRSGNSPLLLPYHTFRKDLAGLEKLGPMGLAVWFMDDGCKATGLRFSTEGFGEELNYKLAAFLGERFGIDVRVARDGEYFYLAGGVDAKRRLVELCRPYIHPSMAYKFDVTGNKKNCKFCGDEFWFYERNALNCLNCGKVSCKLQALGTVLPETIESIIPDGSDWVYDFTLAEHHNYVSNGLISHNCVDEIDVVRDPRAYEEAKLIPAPINGQMPITVLVSTRKFAFGLVQKEIDEAEETGLLMRHWNIIDCTEACPPERHLPDGPRTTLYRSDEELRAVTEDVYETYPEDRQKKFERDDNVMEGCSTCRLFPMCKGNLATKQKSKSPLLKPINHTINQFRAVSVPTARAQLLCKKPSSEGLIYPALERDIHGLTAAQMANKITGDNYREDLTKDELIDVMRSAGMKFHAGMDFGYSHNFAVAIGATDGYRGFLIGGISQAELDPVQQVDVCNKKLRHFNATIYADPENPQMAKFLKKAGFKLKDWKKNAGSVMGGIDVVRSLLRPGIGEPRFYYLKGDEDCELIIKRMSQYHWKLDPDGTIGKTPDDTDDDECFTGETEILTKKHGWVRFDALRRLTSIAAINEDGSVKYEPAHLIKKEYEGTVFTVDNKNVGFTSTRKHEHVFCLNSEFQAGKLKFEKMTMADALESPVTLCIPTPKGSLMVVTPIKKQQVTEHEFDGTVYCVTTTTGMFLARNNGRTFVAGNCDATRYWLMNVFATKGGGAKVDGGKPDARPDPRALAGHKLFRQILQENGAADAAEEGEGKGSQGGFKWNI